MKEDVYLEPIIARSPAFLFRRVSWGAIFAGLVVTMVVQLTLTVLGVAIGASTIDPLRGDTPGQGLAIGSAIWMVITALISLFVGAFVAGRLSGGPRRADGMLHGVVTWGVSTLAMVLLLTTTLGAIVGGVGSLLSGAIGQAGQGQGQQAMAGITSQVRQMFPQTGALLPPTGREQATQPSGRLTELAMQDPQLAAALAKLQAAGGASAAPSDRDQVINILTTQHGMDQQQAQNLLSQWDQQIQQAKTQLTQQARETGQAAAEGVSKGAWWAFIALILGIVVSAWAGWTGTASLPNRTDETAMPPSTTGRTTGPTT